MEQQIQISLAAARVNANLTQEDVAKIMHVRKQTIGSFRCNVLMWLKIMFISRGYKVEDHRADNLSLSERVKERYKKLYGGVFFKRYILGLCVMAEGIIYDMFSPERHVVDCEAIAEEYKAKYGREF